MTIRSRLAVSYGAGVVVTLMLVGVAVWWQMGNALRGSLQTALQTRAAGVLVSLENAGQAGLQEADQAAPGVFAALFAADGSLVDASSDTPPGIRPVDGVVDVGGHAYLVARQAAPDGSIVVTGADLRPVTDAQVDLARVLVGVGLAVGSVSLLGGWFLAGRALRPVGRLSAEAASIGPGDLDRRLARPVRLDEVGRLALTLNAMLERIAETLMRQRLFVAMASHELRTPLAALRAELDVAEHPDATVDEYRAALRQAQGDAIRLTSLSTSLLELAAAPGDADGIARAPVSLPELCAAVSRDLEPLARQHGANLAFDVPDELVWVDRTRIEHAVGNLVLNAIVHGRGTVEVRAGLRGDTIDRTLSVEVLDRGPGIAGDSADDLFAPFRRGTRAGGSGSGLGLATVASAVRAHAGTYGADDRAGGGARFWFEVPCGQAGGGGPTAASLRAP